MSSINSGIGLLQWSRLSQSEVDGNGGRIGQLGLGLIHDQAQWASPASHDPEYLRKFQLRSTRAELPCLHDWIIRPGQNFYRDGRSIDNASSMPRWRTVMDNREERGQTFTAAEGIPEFVLGQPVEVRYLGTMDTQIMAYTKLDRFVGPDFDTRCWQASYDNSSAAEEARRGRYQKRRRNVLFYVAFCPVQFVLEELYDETLMLMCLIGIRLQLEILIGKGDIVIRADSNEIMIVLQIHDRYRCFLREGPWLWKERTRNTDGSYTWRASEQVSREVNNTIIAIPNGYRPNPQHNVPPPTATSSEDMPPLPSFVDILSQLKPTAFRDGGAYFQIANFDTANTYPDMDSASTLSDTLLKARSIASFNMGDLTNVSRVDLPTSDDAFLAPLRMLPLDVLLGSTRNIRTWRYRAREGHIAHGHIAHGHDVAYHIALSPSHMFIAKHGIGVFMQLAVQFLNMHIGACVVKGTLKRTAGNGGLMVILQIHERHALLAWMGRDEVVEVRHNGLPQGRGRVIHGGMPVLGVRVSGGGVDERR